MCNSLSCVVLFATAVIYFVCMYANSFSEIAFVIALFTHIKSPFHYFFVLLITSGKTMES